MNIVKRYSLFFNILQRVIDLLILLIITWALNYIYGPSELYRMLGIYGSLMLPVLFHFSNIYRSWRSTRLTPQIQRLFLSWALVVFLFNALILVLSTPDQFDALWPFALLKTKIFMIWSFAVFLGLALIRVTVRLLLSQLRAKGFNQRNAVIAGAGESGLILARYLIENDWMGIQLKGIFDDRLPKDHSIKITPTHEMKVRGEVSNCPEFTLTNNIDMVFIALPMRAEGKINSLIWNLGIKGVGVFLVPDLFTLGIQKTKIHQFGDLHLLDLNLFPTWKRIFDIIFSSIVIIGTIPLWLVIIMLIKLEDGGPIFYRHNRIMENGKIFGCLKFRTMHADADKKLKTLLDENEDFKNEWEHTYKLKVDPRVTKIGKFLRKTSLDELPQFFNALVGQMSVVGARPIVYEELERYYKEMALTYCAMKPGITGPWQASKRSDTEDYYERVELDRSYVLNCSLWIDLRIILITIWRVLKPKGAY